MCDVSFSGTKSWFGILSHARDGSTLKLHLYARKRLSLRDKYLGKFEEKIEAIIALGGSEYTRSTSSARSILIVPHLDAHRALKSNTTDSRTVSFDILFELKMSDGLNDADKRTMELTVAQANTNIDVMISHRLGGDDAVEDVNESGVLHDTWNPLLRKIKTLLTITESISEVWNATVFHSSY